MSRKGHTFVNTQLKKSKRLTLYSLERFQAYPELVNDSGGKLSLRILTK